MNAEGTKKTSFTYELTNDQQELLLGVMLNGNYRKREVPYSLWSIEGDHFNATLYEKEKHGKRKLCVQGSKAEDFVLFVLEPHVLGAATLGYETILNPDLVAPHAGSDESGKGDYFGPLVVCCAYTDEALSEKMQEMGVKDCKQMSDKSVLMTGAKLRALLGPTAQRSRNCSRSAMPARASSLTSSRQRKLPFSAHSRRAARRSRSNSAIRPRATSRSRLPRLSRVRYSFATS